MIERKRVVSRVISNLLFHWTTIIPVTLGVFGLMMKWGLDLSVLWYLAPVAGILMAAGLLSARALLSIETITGVVTKQLEDEEHRQTEQSLDELAKHLEADGDYRTEDMLRELRGLASALEGTSWEKGVNSYSRAKIKTEVEALFEPCVRNLKQTLRLLEEANDASSTKVRRALLKQRDTLIEEVNQGIKALAKVLETVQVMAATKQTTDVRQRSSDLIAALKAAETAASRMSDVSGQSHEDFEEE